MPDKALMLARTVLSAAPAAFRLRMKVATSRGGEGAHQPAFRRLDVDHLDAGRAFRERAALGDPRRLRRSVKRGMRVFVVSIGIVTTPEAIATDCGASKSIIASVSV